MASINACSMTALPLRKELLMIDIRHYMAAMLRQLRQLFDRRLLYVGLQGSYSREEATEESDIDVMLVLDRLTPADFAAYRELLGRTEHPEKACGFICGKEELANWNRLEICHLLHTTVDYYGSLKDLLPEYRREDVAVYIRLSVCNLYHELCHRYIHGEPAANRSGLIASYKQVFFILQNITALKTGRFCHCKQELLSCLEGTDYKVLCTAAELSRGAAYDFDRCYALLFDWCQDVLRRNFD